MKWSSMVQMVCLVLVASAVWACESDAPGDLLSTEELMNPETCKDCHPDHYAEWSGSMHAYAADDPVFLAMNKRGQEETGGALGDFCVQCHAPMAVRTGATTDGLNLDDVPQHLKGVTCYFCHSVDAVEGTHNNPLRLATDGVLRGGIPNPIFNGKHKSAYSALHDRNSLESAKLCGSCHDIVTPAPNSVHLERTYSEWQKSLFSNEDPPGAFLTCGGCHMDGRDDVAADFEGVPLRRVHSHAMPGVDTALTPWPHAEAQLALVQSELDTTLLAEVCVYDTGGGWSAYVDLENIAAGHSFPSGAAHDRRVWVELVAYQGDDVILSSGAVDDGQPLTALEDPQLWRIGDIGRKEDGTEAHMFWDVVRYDSALLPAPTARSPADPNYIDTHVIREYVMTAAPTRVTVRVRMRAVGLDVVDDLIGTGHLDASIRDRFPTFTLATTVIEWTEDAGSACVPDL